MESLNINTGVSFDGLGLTNFNPEDVQADETINAVFVVDTSGSMSGLVDELNASVNAFVNEFKDSHVKDKLFVSIIEFNSHVTVVSGFQPIWKIAENGPLDFSKKMGGETALYDAVDTGLKNAIEYREQLEASGITVKTILYVITDGHNNTHNKNSSNGTSQHKTPGDIKKKITDLLTEERNFASFSSVLFSICNKNHWDSGQNLQAHFEKERESMGIQYLAPVGSNGKEIRSMIKFISSSISSVSSGGSVSVPSF